MTIDSPESMRKHDRRNAGNGWSPDTSVKNDSDGTALGTLKGTGNHGETCPGGDTGGTGTLSTLNGTGDKEKN